MAVALYAFERSHHEPNTGCWLWAGSVDRASIPMARIDGRTRSIRAAIAEEMGFKLSGSLSSTPGCGQQACVNPDHIKVVGKNSQRTKPWTPQRIMASSEVAESGCWNWTRPLLNKRYGAASEGGKSVSSHRLSYRVFIGKIPDGLCVLHSCDNPRCVNPNHLFLGTQEDNILDMRSKGRANPFGRNKRNVEG